MATATEATADFIEEEPGAVARAVHAITAPVTDRQSRAVLALAAGTALAALAPTPLDVVAVFPLAIVCVEWGRKR